MRAGLCRSEKGYYYFPGPLGIRAVHRAALLLTRKETLDFSRSQAASGTLGPSSEHRNSLSPSIPTPGRDLVSFWGFSLQWRLLFFAPSRGWGTETCYDHRLWKGCLYQDDT